MTLQACRFDTFDFLQAKHDFQNSRPWSHWLQSKKKLTLALDVTWYDMMWHDGARCDMTWHDVTLRDMTWRDMTCHDVTWGTRRGMTWHDVTWRDIMRHNATWRDVTQHDVTWRAIRISTQKEWTLLHVRWLRYCRKTIKTFLGLKLFTGDS